MIKIKEAIIVEGKYDIQKLNQIVDTCIIETNGFRIFKDKQKIELIKDLAYKNGIIILTDSDSAGFIIRNYLKGTIPNEYIKHAYIPEIKGKEKRKNKYSKEGILGVEGIEKDIILDSLKKANATFINNQDNIKSRDKITNIDLYELGLCGRDNSKQYRLSLLKYLNLPKYLSTKSLLSVLNANFDKESLINICKNIEHEID